MFISGLAFVLYALRLSGSNGFWKNLRNADTATHKLAVLFQNIRKLAYKNTFRKEMQYLKKCKLSAISLQYTRNLLDGRVLKTKN